MNDNKISFGFIHWFVEQRELQLKITTTENVCDWAERIAEQARKGAALGIDCGRMCHDCAFKKDQEHTNDYLEAVDGAVLQLVSAGEFNCHTADYENSNKPCAGFLYAKLFLNNQE